MAEPSPRTPPDTAVDRPEGQSGANPKLILAFAPLAAFFSGIGDGHLAGGRYYGMYDLFTVVVFPASLLFLLFVVGCTFLSVIGEFLAGGEGF